MRLSRSLTSQICRVLIGVLLIAQLAVSAYACPGAATKSVSMSGGSPTAMADGQDASVDAAKAVGACDQMSQMDSSSPNLCLEHCRTGHQSSDTAPAPIVATMSPALLYFLPAELESSADSSPSPVAMDRLLASAPPPHAILHCVLRI
jgi:hypothetical protein